MTEQEKEPELKQEEPTPIGLEAQCWSCSIIWNVTLLPPETKGVKCTCGGYVVTPSGKIQSRPFYDIFDSRAPLLDPDEKRSIVLLDGGEVKTKRIILPGD